MQFDVLRVWAFLASQYVPSTRLVRNHGDDASALCGLPTEEVLRTGNEEGTHSEFDRHQPFHVCLEYQSSGSEINRLTNNHRMPSLTSSIDMRHSCLSGQLSRGGHPSVPLGGRLVSPHSHSQCLRGALRSAFSPLTSNHSIDPHGSTVPGAVQAATSDRPQAEVHERGGVIHPTHSAVRSVARGQLRGHQGELQTAAHVELHRADEVSRTRSRAMGERSAAVRVHSYRESHASPREQSPPVSDHVAVRSGDDEIVSHYSLVGHGHLSLDEEDSLRHARFPGEAELHSPEPELLSDASLEVRHLSVGPARGGELLGQIHSELSPPAESRGGNDGRRAEPKRSWSIRRVVAGRHELVSTLRQIFWNEFVKIEMELLLELSNKIKRN